MAVFYGVPSGKKLVIAGPADVTVRGGEMPIMVDDLAEAQEQAPSISALDPATVESGAADLVLKITGEGFTGQTVIVFGTLDEPTTLNDDGTVSTGVKPSLFAPAAVPVKVRNGPLPSNSMDFTFTDPGAGGTAQRRTANAQKGKKDKDD